MHTSAFEVIPEEMLASVAGGQNNPGYDPNNNALGRVGPGTGWSWLGNHYTPEALAHDRAVRDAKANGASGFQAHMGALPKLPAAIGSWFRAKLAPGPQDRSY
jgi:hypothetical protein